jgi:hypothetical protein
MPRQNRAHMHWSIAKSILEFVRIFSRISQDCVLRCPSPTILGIVDDVKGKVGGCRLEIAWDRLLFRNFDLDRECLRCISIWSQPEPRRIFYRDPQHSSIRTRKGGRSTIYHQLQISRTRLMFAVLGFKGSAWEVVMINGFDGKRFPGGESQGWFMPSDEIQVQSTVNLEKMKYFAGLTKIRS